MSTNVYTGLSPFNFIRKHFMQIYLWAVSYERSYMQFLTAFITNISQADLQKVFANKIKRAQACIDARHHFQQLL
jgi:hypothetical protein